MAVTAEQVKELREKTGVGMMDCKNALSQSDGDFEKAIQILREKGLSAAAKKSDRSTNEGRIFTALNSDKTQGVILEVNCETDFVSGNDQFIEFGQSVANALLNSSINQVENLGEAEVAGRKISDILPDKILKLGEKISFKRLQKVEDKNVAEYVHMNGKIGVIVSFNTQVSEEMGRGVAMHVAAINPPYIRREEVPSADLETERSVIKAQVLKEGKPEAIVDKIVEGKLGRFYKENCLLEQDFVKNSEVVIKNYLPEGSTINQSIRFSLG